MPGVVNNEFPVGEHSELFGAGQDMLDTMGHGGDFHSSLPRPVGQSAWRGGEGEGSSSWSPDGCGPAFIAIQVYIFLYTKFDFNLYIYIYIYIYIMVKYTRKVIMCDVDFVLCAIQMLIHS